MFVINEPRCLNDFFDALPLPGRMDQHLDVRL